MNISDETIREVAAHEKHHRAVARCHDLTPENVRDIYDDIRLVCRSPKKNHWLFWHKETDTLFQMGPGVFDAWEYEGIHRVGARKVVEALIADVA